MLWWQSPMDRTFTKRIIRIKNRERIRYTFCIQKSLWLSVNQRDKKSENGNQIESQSGSLPELTYLIILNPSLMMSFKVSCDVLRSKFFSSSVNSSYGTRHGCCLFVSFRSSPHSQPSFMRPSDHTSCTILQCLLPKKPILLATLHPSCR